VAPPVARVLVRGAFRFAAEPERVALRFAADFFAGVALLARFVAGRFAAARLAAGGRACFVLPPLPC
jgi:hypothetical protein